MIAEEEGKGRNSSEISQEDKLLKMIEEQEERSRLRKKQSEARQAELAKLPKDEFDEIDLGSAKFELDKDEAFFAQAEAESNHTRMLEFKAKGVKAYQAYVRVDD